MMQMSPQHSLDSLDRTFVETDCIVEVYYIVSLNPARGRGKNHYVEFAIADRARLSWHHRGMALRDDVEKDFDNRLLDRLHRQCSGNARSVGSGGEPYVPAQNVCDLHDHLDDDERRECREKQRWLGLPCVSEDEESDSDDG